MLLVFARVLKINLSSLHLAAAATATSLYCFHLSSFVGEVKEVDRVKEVKPEIQT